jgi:hypothetical protein
MAEKEYYGITQNDIKIQGKVIGDPIIQSENLAFMVIRTVIAQQEANGQWVETPQDMPVMTQDPKKVATMRDYIKDGRTLLIDGYYKSWTANGAPQHAFVAKKISFGPKKWEPAEDQTPALPS